MFCSPCSPNRQSSTINYLYKFLYLFCRCTFTDHVFLKFIASYVPLQKLDLLTFPATLKLYHQIMRRNTVSVVKFVLLMLVFVTVPFSISFVLNLFFPIDDFPVDYMR